MSYFEDPLEDQAKEKIASEKQRKAEYKATFGTLKGYARQPNIKIKESFRWAAAPEFQVVSTGKNKVSIKGVAVRANQISLNKRKYVGEELAKAARTFIGVPVTINHAPYDKRHPMYDGRKVVGNTRWAEYEDKRLECILDVNKQPYVDLVRNKSVEIKGLSIEADFLFNRCSHCGKDFHTIDSFKHHMVNEHFIKNFNYEPRGMVGRAISIVLAPEVAGVPNTELSVMEMGKFGDFNSLCETIYSIKKEGKTGMSKDTTSTVKTPEEEEEEEEEKKEELTPDLAHGLEEPAHQLVEDSPVEPEGCAEGTVWDPETNQCVKVSQENFAEIVRILDNKVTEQKRDFEKILSVADKNITESNTRIRTLEEWLSMEQRGMIPKLFVNYGKKINKLETLLKNLATNVDPFVVEYQAGKGALRETESLRARMDNLEHKLRGNFKGVNKPLKETKDTYYKDPLKQKRRRDK